jgi:hypothetical protein
MQISLEVKMLQEKILQEKLLQDKIHLRKREMLNKDQRRMIRMMKLSAKTQRM